MPASRLLSFRARAARWVLGSALVAVGVPFLVRAELGVAPFDVLNTGVSDALDLSFGLVFTIDGLIFFLIGALLGGRPGLGSLCGGVILGPLINVVLSQIPEYERLAVRIPLLGGGILILAVGICLVITSDFGAGPTEVVMLGLVRHRVPVVPARWLSDGVPMLLGVALGGALGVGTLVFLVAMGPLVKLGLRRLRYVPRGLRAADPVENVVADARAG